MIFRAVLDSPKTARIALFKDRWLARLHDAKVTFLAFLWVGFRGGYQFSPELRAYASRYLLDANASKSFETQIDKPNKKVRSIPYPWFTYPFLDFLGSLDIRQKRILELGGGTGSAWWASRCEQLTVVESSKPWAEAIIKSLKPLDSMCDFEVLLDQDYFGHTFFDQLLVDWRWDLVVLDAYLMPKRLNLLRRLLDITEINPFVALVVDDTDSEQYPELADELSKRAGLTISFTGQRRGSSNFTETSLYVPKGFRGWNP